MKTLTKYVTFSIAVLLSYAAMEFFYANQTGLTHDTLTTCMFAFFGTEIGSCCLIQIVKTAHKGKDSEEWDSLDINEEDSNGQG